MKIAEDRPSLPLSPDRSRKVSFESLSKVDWSSVLRFQAREPLSDDDDDSPRAGEPQLCSEGTVQVASKGCLGKRNLLRCCPAKADSPGRESKSGAVRPHTLPIPRSGNVPTPGGLPQQGPIKLNTGPIITHSAIPRGAIKSIYLPSMIPTDCIGKKKPPGYDSEEPNSPEVTCLGQVRDKQKAYKQIKKSSDKKQNKIKKKKAASSPFEKRKQATSKQSWEARQSMERKRGSGKKELGKELDRFRSDYRAVPSNAVYSRGERGALLTAALIHVLSDVGSRRGEGIGTEYVPQVPPRNSLLLIRASRNLERPSETPGYEDPNNSPMPVVPKNTNLRRHASLPKSPPEICIWKRRSIAQPSALDIRTRPIKLQIKEPKTR